MKASAPVYMHVIDDVFLKKSANGLRQGDEIICAEDGKYSSYNGKKVPKLTLEFLKMVYNEKEIEDRVLNHIIGHERSALLELIRETFQKNNINFSYDEANKIIDCKISGLEEHKLIGKVFPGIDFGMNYSLKTVLKIEKLPKNTDSAPEDRQIYSYKNIFGGIRVFDSLKPDVFSRPFILGADAFEPEEAIPHVTNFIQKTGFGKKDVVKYLLGKVREDIPMPDLAKFLGNIDVLAVPKLESLLSSDILHDMGLNEIDTFYSSCIGLSKKDFCAEIQEPFILEELDKLSKKGNKNSADYLKNSIESIKNSFNMKQPPSLNLSNEKKALVEKALLTIFKTEAKRMKTSDDLIALTKHPKYLNISDIIKEFRQPFVTYVEDRDTGLAMAKVMDNYRPRITAQKEKLDALVAGINAL